MGGFLPESSPWAGDCATVREGAARETPQALREEGIWQPAAAVRALCDPRGPGGGRGRDLRDRYAGPGASGQEGSDRRELLPPQRRRHRLGLILVTPPHTPLAGSLEEGFCLGLSLLRRAQRRLITHQRKQSTTPHLTTALKKVGILCYAMSPVALLTAPGLPCITSVCERLSVALRPSARKGPPHVMCTGRGFSLVKEQGCKTSPVQMFWQADPFGEQAPSFPVASCLRCRRWLPAPDCPLTPFPACLPLRSKLPNQYSKKGGKKNINCCFVRSK